MKTRNTLIILIATAGLFCFIQFYESKLPTTQMNDYHRTHPFDFDEDAITGVDITNSEDKIELRRQEDTWLMISPVNDRAELGLVHGILSELHDTESTDSFEAGAKNGGTPSLKDIGLETPAIRVKLTGPTAPAEILVGNDTAVQGQMYARLADSNKVWIVSNSLKAQLQKKADDFRDHRLMDFTPNRVNRLDVKSPAGEIEVLQDHGVWSVNKPLKARADGRKIFDLIAQAVNLRIDSFLPASGANLATYGLAEPRGSITFAEQDNNTPEVLEIGQPVGNDKKHVYAKLSTRDAILVLPENINDVLFIKPNDVRDRQLLELNLDMVDRIHIEAAGKPKLTIGRKGEDWTLKSFDDLPANNNLVLAFVQYLRSQRITSFVSDVASDLPKYGLDKPPLRVTFTSYASQNTAESAAGEDTILTVAFGKSDGDIVYARLENEPYIVSIPRMLPDGQSIFEAISPDPVYWEDLAIFNYKPEDIASLQITADGRTLSLERSGSAPWKLKQGLGELNQTRVQSLVNTLASLRAARSVGLSTAGLGLEKPSLVIAFTTSTGQSGKLSIGSETSEVMWNAAATGRAGSFLISKPDYQALDADLTAPAEPSPSPSPAESPSPSGTPAGVQ